MLKQPNKTNTQKSSKMQLWFFPPKVVSESFTPSFMRPKHLTSWPGERFVCDKDSNVLQDGQAVQWFTWVTLQQLINLSGPTSCSLSNSLYFPQKTVCLILEKQGPHCTGLWIKHHRFCFGILSLLSTSVRLLCLKWAGMLCFKGKDKYHTDFEDGLDDFLGILVPGPWICEGYKKS